jgi:hypothetical protein
LLLFWRIVSFVVLVRDLPFLLSCSLFFRWFRYHQGCSQARCLSILSFESLAPLFFPSRFHEQLDLDPFSSKFVCRISVCLGTRIESGKLSNVPRSEQGSRLEKL